jgi:hypothetical protein
MLSFEGVRFPIVVILVCIRWYTAYPLSDRHIEEVDVLTLPMKRTGRNSSNANKSESS